MSHHLDTIWHTIDALVIAAIIYFFDTSHMIALLTIVWLAIKICKELHLGRWIARHFRRNKEEAK